MSTTDTASLGHKAVAGSASSNGSTPPVPVSSAGAGAGRPQRRTRQPHGTIACYTAGCSCFECRVAWTDYQVARSRQPMKVDPREALSHIAKLKSQGMDYQDIAYAAGMPVSSLTYVRTHSRKIRRETADAILGVVGPRHRRPLDAERVAELRLQGFTPRQIAEELGCSERQVYRVRAS